MTYFLLIKKMNKEIDYKKIEDKLLVFYPNITEKKAKIITKQLFQYWWDIIENIDKIEK